MTRIIAWAGRVTAIVAVAAAVVGLSKPVRAGLGKQNDGGYLVSTGQRVDAGALQFKGRPSDMALHPDGGLVAVMKKDSVFLINVGGVVAGSDVPLGAEPGFHGLIWTPNGKRLIATTAAGHLQVFDYDGAKLSLGPKIVLANADEKTNPVPGGMAINRAGTTLYVAAANLNSIVQVDLSSLKPIARFPVETLPYDVRLNADETALIVSNWGGRIPRPGDDTAMSQDMKIVVDRRGAPSTGTVSVIDLATKDTANLDVGIHPTAVTVDGPRAYVANTMSDTISEIDVAARKVVRTIPIRWGKLRLLGCMPTAIQVVKDTLYVCDGGDNALCEIDLKRGEVRGFRPAGYFPIALAVEGGHVLVLNSKGNGSVANTAYGRIGNAHDFEGTLSIVDTSSDLKSQTDRVAENNRWTEPNDRPQLAVYKGAIKHVLYIIKENRTYDEIYGDLPEGNGDAKLCSLGETVMPNHRALAREFTLFDNGYVSGTNSADGHAWSTQAIANDYLEHFYVGYSRTYPDDGDCAMSISSAGCLWDVAAKKHKSIRDYGEFCDDDKAEYFPYRPKNWFEAWDDRQKGTHKFTFVAHTLVAGLKPYVSPHVHYWPLIQSDQSRADEFIKEYDQFSAQDKVPDLSILSLPCDHSEGVNPDYPTPRAMMADNDLALGRVVERITKSPQWKDTCIFVIEDDAQSGPDHVDGHRTSYLVISPYNKRHTVDSNVYTTTNMLRSIELMLGFDPMNRFDALARPIDSCFNDVPDLTPFTPKPNNVPLDERSPAASEMSPSQKYWAQKSAQLDWSHLDAPNSYWLNRVIWASVHNDDTPYPGRAGETPERADGE